MKKPKGKELITEQKQTNKQLSKERIGVEHHNFSNLFDYLISYFR